MADIDGALITVGRIIKPFGVWGQVRVESLTDIPGRLEQLDQVILVLGAGRQVKTRVTEVERNGRSYLFRFAAFSTPEEAKAYQGAWISIPQGPVPPAPEGQWYQFELIGMTVVDQAGSELGVLEEVLDLPGQKVFVVRKEDLEILIPASRKWVTHIDAEGKRMTVCRPDEME